MIQNNRIFLSSLEFLFRISIRVFNYFIFHIWYSFSLSFQSRFRDGDNAIFAIKDTGDIYIRTKDEGKNVIIEIEDTGTGIAKENISKVFEPFFTTKNVGEGTGLGMSISYKIIESHSGKIDIDSELGKGTKFTITLPKDGLKEKEGSKNDI